MNFLISPASLQQLTDCGPEGLFEGTDKNLYNYKIELEEDMFRITDSLGRMVPFDLDSLPALVNILSKINAYTNKQVLFDRYNLAELLDGASL